MAQPSPIISLLSQPRLWCEPHRRAQGGRRPVVDGRDQAAHVLLFFLFFLDEIILLSLRHPSPPNFCELCRAVGASAAKFVG